MVRDRHRRAGVWSIATFESGGVEGRFEKVRIWERWVYPAICIMAPQIVRSIVIPSRNELGKLCCSRRLGWEEVFSGFGIESFYHLEGDIFKEFDGLRFGVEVFVE
jgi:hypothetical protein